LVFTPCSKSLYAVSYEHCASYLRVTGKVDADVTGRKKCVGYIEGFWKILTIPSYRRGKGERGLVSYIFPLTRP
jgi:hypothetical protein